MTAALTLEDIQHLSEEVRHLVRAGMPLEETLADAGRGRGRRLQQLTQAISDGLNQGKSLEELVQKESAGEGRMLASAVGAGVRSGDLGLTIEMMGDFATDVVSLRSRLLQAAAYPLTIVAMACVLVVVILQHALQMFLDAFVYWDVKTHWLLWKLLEWNRDMPWWTLLIPLAGMVLLLIWSASGRAAAMAFRGPERLLLLLPGVYALVRDLQSYTLSRMLSLLTERGLPLQDALRLAGGATGNYRLEIACREIAKRIESGGSVAQEAGKLPTSRYRLPSLLNACLQQVEHDEARMVHRLRSVAEFYRTRLDRNLAWLKLLMPVMLFTVIGGGCVLTYAIMVFWPVTELYRNIGM
jgi:type II secretory pathway component PulF